MTLQDAIQKASAAPAPHLEALFKELLAAKLFVPTLADDSTVRFGSYLTHEDEKISIVLGRLQSGEPINILFTSLDTMSRWAKEGRQYAELPSRVLLEYLRGTRLRTIIDPSGPVSFELTSSDIDVLAMGNIPEEPNAT